MSWDKAKNVAPRRILVVQLADIGDLVLSTPALQRLRYAHLDAHIALLTTQHAAPILSPFVYAAPKQAGSVLDEVILFDKHTFDSPRALAKPANLRKAAALALRLRRGRYDTVLFFHHFSTRFGALKFAALAWAAGAKRVIGLENGNGRFLTERLPDEGFGAHHQAEYWLALVERLGQMDDVSAAAHFASATNGAPEPHNPPTVRTHVPQFRRQHAQVGISGADLDRARHLLMPLDASRPIIAIHAGSGGYSTARRWEPEKFAAVADTLVERHHAQIVLVGGKGDDNAAVIAAMRSPALDLTGGTTLGQLAAVLSRCVLFIGADSGVMHIAAASGTSVVAIFGPSNANAWAPWASEGRAVVVRSAPACSPCSYVGTEVGLRSGCAARTCMRMVTAEQATAAAETLLSVDHVPEGRYAATPVRVRDPAANHFPPDQRVHILGMSVDNLTFDDWLRMIGEWIAEPGDVRARQVCTMNPEFIMMARRDVNFRNILRRAALCVPDGVGLLWAARRRGTPLRERVTGSDGVPKIAASAAQQGWRLYFLGAAPGVAEKAAQVLRARHPSLTIVGTYSGSPAPEEEDEIIARINASEAHLLFVAFGAPEQDKWIARNLPRLQVRMAMGVGGTFDFIAGVLPRAPGWMQRWGLEWLFRLILQPRRIGRMLRLPRFVWAVVTSDL